MTGRPIGAGIVPDAVRFERHYVPEPNSGCWLWTGSVMNSGYGNFTTYVKDERSAHRFSYKQHVGPIADDLTIDHICCNKLCVNPEHLRLMTRGQNTKRYYNEMLSCRAGHEYTVENTKIVKGSFRQCRACNRIRDTMRYYNKRRVSNKPIRQRSKGAFICLS